MFQLVYASRPFGFDAAVLIAILFEARKYNAAHDITGALLVRNDLYIQLLEGAEPDVRALYARIARDDRHAHVTVLGERHVQRRMFADWAMKDDPLPTNIWPPDDTERMLAAPDPGAAFAVFTRLAAGRLQQV